jgi:hypothetical protein
MSNNTLSVVKMKSSNLYWNYDNGFSEPTTETASMLTTKEVHNLQYTFQHMDLSIETLGEV